MQCLHCICENCINNFDKCPEDNTDIIAGINAFNESFTGSVLLDNLCVTCIFKEKGCSWRGNFNDFYNEHLNKCPFNDEKNNENNNNNYENELKKLNKGNLIRLECGHFGSLSPQEVEKFQKFLKESNFFEPNIKNND